MIIHVYMYNYMFTLKWSSNRGHCPGSRPSLDQVAHPVLVVSQQILASVDSTAPPKKKREYLGIDEVYIGL